MSVPVPQPPAAATAPSPRTHHRRHGKRPQHPAAATAPSPRTHHRTSSLPSICDLIVIGAGPAGTAAAIQAARGGARVRVFEKASPGRDKACGDGLTPRAVTALARLGIGLDGAHRIDGLRMIAGGTRRELPWPSDGGFASHGAVWPRRGLDRHLADTAEQAGAGDRMGHGGDPRPERRRYRDRGGDRQRTAPRRPGGTVERSARPCRSDARSRTRGR